MDYQCGNSSISIGNFDVLLRGPRGSGFVLVMLGGRALVTMLCCLFGRVDDVGNIVRIYAGVARENQEYHEGLGPLV